MSADQQGTGLSVVLFISCTCEQVWCKKYIKKCKCSALNKRFISAKVLEEQENKIKKSKRTGSLTEKVKDSPEKKQDPTKKNRVPVNLSVKRNFYRN